MYLLLQEKHFSKICTKVPFCMEARPHIYTMYKIIHTVRICIIVHTYYCKSHHCKVYHYMLQMWCMYVVNDASGMTFVMCVISLTIPEIAAVLRRVNRRDAWSPVCGWNVVKERPCKTALHMRWGGVHWLKVCGVAEGTLSSVAHYYITWCTYPRAGWLSREFVCTARPLLVYYQVFDNQYKDGWMFTHSSFTK